MSRRNYEARHSVKNHGNQNSDIPGGGFWGGDPVPEIQLPAEQSSVPNTINRMELGALALQAKMQRSTAEVMGRMPNTIKRYE